MVDLRKGVVPQELADLVDLSERPRAGNWSLRAALTRYAQGQPQRVGALLDLVRRIEFALAEHVDDLRSSGQALWAAIEADASSAPVEADGFVVGLLRAAIQIDRVGDALASWAVALEGERPDAAVDVVIADVTRQLSALGVPEQERPRPGARGRG